MNEQMAGAEKAWKISPSAANKEANVLY